MDGFSYTDNVRAAFASCLPCFAASRAESASNPPQNASLPELRTTTNISSRPSSSSNDLEHLLRDPDLDGISLHSNVGGSAHRRARRRRRPKFSITLFGYTLFGRQPIYLDEEEEDARAVDRRALLTHSSSTLDSDAAPLDASTIERLTSPDHVAALAVQAEEGRRKAERRARRQERKARARAEALAALNGAPHPDADVFEGFQGSGTGVGSPPPYFHGGVEVVRERPGSLGLSLRGGDEDDGSRSGDADDADLGGELYARKKKPSGALSGSGSDSRSRTSASLSAGDVSHIQNPHVAHQSIPYPHTEMCLPAQMGKKHKRHRSSKRTSTISSATSQSTSTTPYTPVESISEAPAVAASPIPQERLLRDGGHSDFPSVGLSSKRTAKSLDPRAFIARQG